MDRPQVPRRTTPTGEDRAEERVGGEPVCLMHRLCPACGLLADEDPPTRCPHCDAHIDEQ